MTVSLLPNGIFVLTAMAESPDFRVSETEAAPGDETVLTISAENNPGIRLSACRSIMMIINWNGEIL